MNKSSQNNTNTFHLAPYVKRATSTALTCAAINAAFFGFVEQFQEALADTNKEKVVNSIVEIPTVAVVHRTSSPRLAPPSRTFATPEPTAHPETIKQDTPLELPTPKPTIAPPSPKENLKLPFFQKGTASTYGHNDGFHCKMTASGDIYNKFEMTAAHKYLPFGTVLDVVNLKTGAKVRVTITDRGPYHGNRILDLSLAAFYKLSGQKTGLLDTGLHIVSKPKRPVTHHHQTAYQNQRRQKCYKSGK